MQQDIPEQRSGDPARALADLDVHPGVTHLDVHARDLVERLERLRADPRAVRADLEDVTELGTHRTAHPLAVEVGARGGSPVL